MKTQFNFILSVLFVHLSFFAQTQENQHHTTTEKVGTVAVEDSTTLLYAFKQGQFKGHFRYFFMHTNNMNKLTDYYANAIGGGLKYETALFHHFQFGISGFYVFNIGSSNLSQTDTITGQKNRYEIGLFDIENPSNHKDIDRLEELFLNYQWKKGKVTFGRQLVNTPFINLQDGRMRPTGIEGIIIEHKINSRHQFQAGYLYSISPRSTTRWYTIGESIGIYSQGVSTTGEKGNYANHINSNWAIYLDYHTNLTQHIKLQLHSVTIDRLLSTQLIQLETKHAVKEKNNLKFAGQFIRQDALVSTTSTNENRYTEKGTHSMTFGIQCEWGNQNWVHSMNYNRITKHGRYLMPREWGKEPFFTFIPRERNEGFGDVHAIVYKSTYSTNNEKWKFGFASGYFQLPDVLNVQLNKYQVPSYLHAAFDLKYSFPKKLKGMEVHLFLTGKYGVGKTYENWAYIQNKVNLGMINLVLNYHF